MAADSMRQATLGATATPDGGCTFRVWAPKADRVELLIESPEVRSVPMQRDSVGYHAVTVEDCPAGTRYWYLLDGHSRRPDPASRSQPDGVHLASEVVARDFAWTDDRWAGIPLETYIIYELHIGTYTADGTFEAAISRLDDLVALGVTAIEVMPIAQFPGHRNWGYDGVYPYAAQSTYGGATGFKRLVDACHARGLAVVLDVVYNHLGPEGNYLRDFGPYFTDRYKTPWGASLNFDGHGSDHVRRFFIENALYWVTECHVDALRLDATQAMADLSAYTVLDELVDAVHAQREALNRRIYLMAETDRSDDRLLRPRTLGGTGMDTQWSDEVEHAIHSILTGETIAYYRGWDKFGLLEQALRHGFVYSGEFSEIHGRRHGSFRTDIPAHQFVVCAQTHDHVGNRKNGDRLGHLIPFDGLKVAAALYLLSPYLPLMFMGEEYDEDNPFQFFTSFGDPQLREAVRKGRANDYKEFYGEGDGPDPEAESTFQRSKLNHDQRTEGRHGVLLALYTELIRLRKTIPALRHLNKGRMHVTGFERQKVLFIHRWHGSSGVCILYNAGRTAASVTAPIPEGEWVCILDSADARWQPDAALDMPRTASPTLPDDATITLPPLSFQVWAIEE